MEQYLSILRKLGLSQIAAMFCWSIVPIAPLFSHLGVALFGCETEAMPLWWQVMSSPDLLNQFSTQLNED